MIGRSKDKDDEGKAYTPHAIGNIEVGLNLSDRRYIKLTGYILDVDTDDEIHARVDRLQDALDRQAVRVDITVKEAQVAAHEQNLRVIAEGYDGIVARKNAGHTIHTQEKTQLANYDQTVRNAKSQIESLKAAIAEGKKRLLLNGAAAP